MRARALFAEEYLRANLNWLVGALFVAAMFAVISGLACFRREVNIATHATSIELAPFA